MAQINISFYSHKALKNIDFFEFCITLLDTSRSEEFLLFSFSNASIHAF